jgi:predicted nucleotidyltransferase
VKEILKELLKKEENILFGYLFGSFATSNAKKTSDVDVALYFKEYSLDNHLDISLKISKATKRECDLVVLNNAKNLYLLEEIITKGILLKDDKEKREMFEVVKHHDYLDFVEFKRMLNAS